VPGLGISNEGDRESEQRAKGGGCPNWKVPEKFSKVGAWGAREGSGLNGEGEGERRTGAGNQEKENGGEGMFYRLKGGGKV